MKHEYDSHCHCEGCLAEGCLAIGLAGAARHAEDMRATYGATFMTNQYHFECCCDVCVAKDSQ